MRLRVWCGLVLCRPAPNGDAAGDVLNLVLTSIQPDDIETVAHLTVSVVGDRDPVRVCKGLNPCGDVDAIAKNIVAFDNNVADMDADPEAQRLELRKARIAFDHAGLDGDGAGDRIDRRGEFKQQAVAHGLNRAAAMRSDQRIDQLATMAAQRPQRSGLIRTH